MITNDTHREKTKVTDEHTTAQAKTDINKETKTDKKEYTMKMCGWKTIKVVSFSFRNDFVAVPKAIIPTNCISIVVNDVMHFKRGV